MISFPGFAFYAGVIGCTLLLYGALNLDVGTHTLRSYGLVNPLAFRNPDVLPNENLQCFGPGCAFEDGQSANAWNSEAGSDPGICGEREGHKTRRY